ncbi:MAG: outer membrane beta-barrel protein [Rhodothalassiaceae bacterium]
MIRAAAALATGLLASAPTLAGPPVPAPGNAVLNRIHPEVDPKGVPLGAGWRLFPDLEVVERYDDNIFSDPEIERADAITLVRPSLSLLGDFQAGSVEAEAYGDLEFYADNPGENVQDFGALARFESRSERRHSIALTAAFDRRAEDRGDPEEAEVASRSQADILRGEALYRYRGGVLRGELLTEVRRLSFLRAADQDRDRVAFRVAPRLGVALGSGLRLFAGPSYEQIRFEQDIDDLGFNRDREETGGSLIARLDGGGLYRAELLVGARHVANDDPAFEDFTLVESRATVDWLPSNLTAVTLVGERVTRSTTQAASSARIDSSVSLLIAHELRRTLLITPSARYTRQAFQGIARDDDLVEAGVTLDYRLNRNVGLVFDYLFTRRESTLAAESFSRHRVTLGLRLSL